MKKILLFVAILFASQFAKAQTEKGTQTLGANLQFFHSTNNGTSINPYNNAVTNVDQKSTTFSIGPSYSYFIANHLDLGAQLYYTTNRSTYGDMASLQKQVSNTYGTNLYLRKYFMYQGKIGIRTGPYLGYSHATATTTNPLADAIYNSKAYTNNYNAGLNCELLFYPTRQLGVSLMVANLSYQHFNTNSNQGDTRGDFVNLNLISNGAVVSVFYVIGSK